MDRQTNTARQNNGATVFVIWLVVVVVVPEEDDNIAAGIGSDKLAAGHCSSLCGSCS